MGKSPYPSAEPSASTLPCSPRASRPSEKKQSMPSIANAIASLSRRAGHSPRSGPARSIKNTGDVYCKKIALAAPVRVVATTKSCTIVAYVSAAAHTSGSEITWRKEPRSAGSRAA
jgi:hypothetical protein